MSEQSDHFTDHLSSFMRRRQGVDDVSNEKREPKFLEDIPEKLDEDVPILTEVATVEEAHEQVLDEAQIQLCAMKIVNEVRVQLAYILPTLIEQSVQKMQEDLLKGVRESLNQRAENHGIHD